MNIDQIACYFLMEWTVFLNGFFNGLMGFFSNFGIIFQISYYFLKHLWLWVYACEEEEAFVLISERSSYIASFKIARYYLLRS